MSQDVYKEKLYWFAGIVEGEGSIFYDEHGNCPVLEIEMTDRDIVSRCGALLRGNAVQTRDNGEDQTSYRIKITGRPMIEITKKILPVLGKRRTKQFKDALRQSDRDAYNIGF